MTVLPIVDRELRVRARRASTQGVRVAAVLVALLLAGFFYSWASAARGGAPGRTLFTALSILAFLFCLFEGLRHTVDSLSEEKREGTLGLLFLTRLQGHDVILGKLAACSLNSIYALLSVAPVLAITLMLGGVTGGQFARMVLVLLNTLFFSMAIGTWASSLNRHPGRSWAAALAMLLLIGGVLPGLGWLSALAGKTAVPLWAGTLLGVLGRLVLGVSPFYGFALELNSSAASSFPGSWTCLLSSHCVAWLFLRRASLVIRHSWQDDPVSQLHSPLSSPTPSDSRKFPASEGTFPNVNTAAEKMRRRFLSKNPVMWLALRRALLQTPVWLPTCLPLVLMLLLALFDRGMLTLAAIGAFLVKMLLRIWVAIQAATSLAQARKNGALELILSTPMTPAGILNGQWMALRHLFLGAALLVWLVSSLVTVLQVLPNLGEFPWKAAVMDATFLLDLIAIAYFSMWLALRLRRPTQAAALGFACVFVLPRLVFCFPWLAVLTDLCFIFWARSKLTRQLRSGYDQTSSE